MTNEMEQQLEQLQQQLGFNDDECQEIVYTVNSLITRFGKKSFWTVVYVSIVVHKVKQIAERIF